MSNSTLYVYIELFVISNIVIISDYTLEDLFEYSKTKTQRLLKKNQKPTDFKQIKILNTV